MSVQSLFSPVPILHRMIQWMGFIKAREMEPKLWANTHTHTDINPSCPFTHPLSSSYCETICVFLFRYMYGHSDRTPPESTCSFLAQNTHQICINWMLFTTLLTKHGMQVSISYTADPQIMLFLYMFLGSYYFQNCTNNQVTCRLIAHFSAKNNMRAGEGEHHFWETEK